MDVGLSYLTLRQNATTLSGGEAQRIKLARELSKRDHGNTIIVIEHNLDVIKTAYWIIDLGPEGGIGGGEIVVAGTPADVAGYAGSYTGQFLKHTLEHQPVERKQAVPA